MGTRLGNDDQAKTVQINKAPKQINFHQSAFKFNFKIKNEEVVEPEYCPKSTSWKPSIGKSLHRIFKKAFNAIGSYKMFVPSAKITVIDYNIKQNFNVIAEPNPASLNYLYDTDSDDTEAEYFQNDDGTQIYHGLANIPLDDQPVEEIMLEMPMFVAV